jgi:hypothetical protein
VANGQNGESSLDSLTMQELQNISHKTIMTEYAKSQGFEFTDEFEEMFNTVFKIVTDSDYED